MRSVLFAGLIAVSATALAPALARAQQADPTEPPQRVRSVTIQRGEPCPKATGGEVVVCTTIVEPYRIPSDLRRPIEPTAANQSWVNRTATADRIGRVAGGLPDTCSPVGTGGQSGCALSWNRAYADDKRGKAREAETVPGGEQ